MFWFGFFLGLALMGAVWLFSRSLGRMARAGAKAAGAQVEASADDMRREINKLTDKLAKIEP